MRNTLHILLSALLLGAAVDAAAQDATGAKPGHSLEIEIQSPSPGFEVDDGTTNIEVEGIASAIGGVRYLDIMFVMDTSTSLKRPTHPSNGHQPVHGCAVHPVCKHHGRFQV